MEVIVTVGAFVGVCFVVLAAYLYTQKVHKQRVAAETAAWRKEVSRQKRSNSAKKEALRKSNPELAKVQAQQQQDAMNSTANTGLRGGSNLGALNGMAGRDLYGRGDL